jgi:hypothetical protein
MTSRRGCAAKKLAHKFKCSRHEQVIQIEISHDIAPEMAESLGDGVGLAIVRFAHIICEAIVILLEDLAGSVYRPPSTTPYSKCG